jgi:hypothetical protein
MKPTYEVKAWQEDDWWLARVVSAGENADPAPLNAITQARTLAKIDCMARDLIATILDVDQEHFHVDLEYSLPDDVRELIAGAKGARAWLDAAQELWQVKSAAAARALTDSGYSLREAATLLDLSHQRVDQLLRSGVDAASTTWAMGLKFDLLPGARSRDTAPRGDADMVVVLRNASGELVANPDQRRELVEQFGAALRDRAEVVDGA